MRPPDYVASIDASLATRLVLTWLWVFAASVDGVAFAWTTKAALARLTKQDERSIRRQINQLEAMGEIRSGRVTVEGKWRRGWEMISRIPQSCSDPSVLHASPGPEDPNRTDESADSPVRTGPVDPIRIPRSVSGTRIPQSEPDPPVRKNRTGGSELRGGFGGGDSPTVSIVPAPAQLQRAQPVVPTAGRGPLVEVERLKEWRQYGGDPERLGPWPSVKVGDRERPALLIPVAKVTSLAEAGVSARDMHRAVHRLAEAVSSGGFKFDQADDPWRGQLLFSGHYEALVEATERHLAVRDRKRREAEAAAEREQQAEAEAEKGRDAFRRAGELIDKHGTFARLTALAKGEA